MPLPVTPPGVIIEISPVLPVPTTAVILVGDTMVKELAATPPNFTEVVPVKLVPVRVTVVPDVPEVGLNELIVGGDCGAI
jgi:hypothetical protein